MAVAEERVSEISSTTRLERSIAALSPEEDLVVRGRALSHLAIEEMIAELHLRAERHLLDRGVRISLPYFDDRRMALRYWSFTVIPKGRILFVPAFVVLATEREVERICAAREFTPSTRQHLLEGMHRLGQAFRTPSIDTSPARYEANPA